MPDRSRAIDSDRTQRSRIRFRWRRGARSRSGFRDADYRSADRRPAGADEGRRSGPDDEIALRIDVHRAGAVERHCNPMNVAAGPDDEVVFERLLLPVVNEI